MPAKLHEFGGQGPSVLLIHGFGADRLGWMANAVDLQQGHRVWAVELPAHGAAEPGESKIAEMVQTVGDVISDLPQPVHLCGHSLGGLIAARLARQHPERFGKVALIAPACLGTGAPDVAFLRDFPSLETEEDALNALRRLVHRERLIQPAMAQHVLAHLAKPGRRAAMAAIADAVLKTAPAELTDDALVIWGAQDKVLPPDGDLITARGALGLLIENAGHLPHVEAAARVNRALLDYLV